MANAIEQLELKLLDELKSISNTNSSNGTKDQNNLNSKNSNSKSSKAPVNSETVSLKTVKGGAMSKRNFSADLTVSSKAFGLPKKISSFERKGNNNSLR